MFIYDFVDCGCRLETVKDFLPLTRKGSEVCPNVSFIRETEERLIKFVGVTLTVYVYTLNATIGFL